MKKTKQVCKDLCQLCTQRDVKKQHCFPLMEPFSFEQFQAFLDILYRCSIHIPSIPVNNCDLFSSGGHFNSQLPPNRHQCLLQCKLPSLTSPSSSLYLNSGEFSFLLFSFMFCAWCSDVFFELRYSLYHLSSHRFVSLLIHMLLFFVAVKP